VVNKLGGFLMALRNIRLDGDRLLRTKARAIEKFDSRTEELLKDLADTLYSTENGIGLAAPQIGVLRRALVIDIGEGLMEVVNPVIKSASGEQTYVEGCLSVPGVYGEVVRPQKMVVEYYDGKGNKKEVEAEGMLAVVLSHEIDHLDGILFKDKVIRFVNPEETESRGN